MECPTCSFDSTSEFLHDVPGLETVNPLEVTIIPSNAPGSALHNFIEREFEKITRIPLSNELRLRAREIVTKDVRRFIGQTATQLK